MLRFFEKLFAIKNNNYDDLNCIQQIINVSNITIAFCNNK